MFLERSDHSANNLQGLARLDGDSVKGALLVEDHCGDLEPPPLTSLEPIWRAAQAGKQCGWRGCRENRKTGNLVIFMQGDGFVLVSVCHFNADIGAVSQADYLWPHMDVAHRVLASPFGDLHHTTRIVLEGEFSLCLDGYNHCRHSLNLDIFL